MASELKGQALLDQKPPSVIPPKTMEKESETQRKESTMDGLSAKVSTSTSRAAKLAPSQPAVPLIYEKGLDKEQIAQFLSSHLTAAVASKTSAEKGTIISNKPDNDSNNGISNTVVSNSVISNKGISNKGVSSNGNSNSNNNNVETAPKTTTSSDLLPPSMIQAATIFFADCLPSAILAHAQLPDYLANAAKAGDTNCPASSLAIRSYFGLFSPDTSSDTSGGTSSPASSTSIATTNGASGGSTTAAASKTPSSSSGEVSKPTDDPNQNQVFLEFLQFLKTNGYWKEEDAQKYFSSHPEMVVSTSPSSSNGNDLDEVTKINAAVNPRFFDRVKDKLSYRGHTSFPNYLPFRSSSFSSKTASAA